MPPPWIGLSAAAGLAVVIGLLARRARSRRLSSFAEEPLAATLPATPMPAGAAPETDAGSAHPPDEASAAVLSSAEILHGLAELGFESSPLPAPRDAAYAAVAPGIGEALEIDATELKHAPRRPLLLPQLLRAMHNDEVSRRELSRIIARDPALAGNLLKLANGAFYRTSDRPVESIDRAVALLGTNGIRSLVATALVQPVFDLSKQAFPRFPQVIWEHTFRAASAAEAHAAVVEDADPFAAQLLGLLMGLGSIVVFRVSLEQYARLGARPDPSVIAALTALHTAPVARRIAASWELSDRIAAALEDQDPDKDPRARSALGRSLHFGRLLAALAVLHLNQRVGEETAKASMLRTGATAFQFESLWGRLTGQSGSKMPRPVPTQQSWRDLGRPS